jgi:hypothetical protein
MVDSRGGPATFDALERELRGLGRSLGTEPPRDDLVAQTLSRIREDQAVPARVPHARIRRRIAWAIAALAVLVVAAVPPVRAAVLELLRLGAVVVRQEPGPAPTPSSSSDAPSANAPAPTASPSALSVSEARAAVTFPFTVPTVLGPPTTVAVTHEGRVVELTWTSSASSRSSAPIRLDVLAGSPDWGYLKRAWTELTPTRVGEHNGLWIGAEHQLQWVDRSGATQPAPARAAGPTLLWVVPTVAGEVTYRLEGPATLARATQIASSAR